MNAIGWIILLSSIKLYIYYLSSGWPFLVVRTVDLYIYTYIFYIINPNCLYILPKTSDDDAVIAANQPSINLKALNEYRVYLVHLCLIFETKFFTIDLSHSILNCSPQAETTGLHAYACVENYHSKLRNSSEPSGRLGKNYQIEEAFWKLSVYLSIITKHTSIPIYTTGIPSCY